MNVRTSLTPAVQIERLQTFRDYRRAKFHEITPDIKASDTVGLVTEELMVLWMVESAPGGKVKLWEALNRLSCAVHGSSHLHLSRPERQKLMATLQRLITEKKVFRHRPTNTLTLTMLGKERLLNGQHLVGIHAFRDKVVRQEPKAENVQQ